MGPRRVFGMRIIDLSQELYEGIIQYPGPKVTIFELPELKWPGYELYSFAFLMPDHVGTHVDAPRHFDKMGEPINKVPLERFIVEAVVLNLSHKKARSSITANDLELALKKTNEVIKPGDGVLLYTGWDEKWETKKYWDNPGISESAAKWLLKKKVSIIGIDGIRLEGAKGHDYIGHTLLLRDNKIPHLENLCNLGKIKDSRVLFIALPLKIRGAGGAPVRAVAIEGMRFKRG